MVFYRIRLYFTCQSSDGRHKLHEHGLPWRHSGLDEDRVVSNLMRNFVEQDGQGRDFAYTLSGDERGTDGQAVGKVVECVGKEVQVSGNFDFAYYVGGSFVLGFFLKINKNCFKQVLRLLYI